MQSETEILNYLKTMKFKRSLFGIDRSDVLEKMRTLNNMYMQIQKQTEQEMKRSAEYDKKIEALAKIFIDVQEQADGIIGKAQSQAKEIVETAEKNAAGITKRTKEDLELKFSQQKQEIMQLCTKRDAVLFELKNVSVTLNQLVQQNFGGEISGKPR